MKTNKSVLWIEDRLSSIYYQMEYLTEKFGVKIETAMTVLDAILHIEEKEYDLKILDLSLPSMEPNLLESLFSNENIYNYTEKYVMHPFSGLVLIDVIKNGILDKKFSRKDIQNIPIIIYSAAAHTALRELPSDLFKKDIFVVEKRFKPSHFIEQVGKCLNV